MTDLSKKISVSTAPFLKDKDTTPKIMMRVVYTLIPIVFASIFYFGLSALLIIITAVTSCMFTECLFNPSEDRLKSLKESVEN